MATPPTKSFKRKNSMKKTLSTFLLALAFVGTLYAATVKRDSVVTVTATTAATTTSLAGTQTTWNVVTVHNHGSVRVGICIVSADDDGTAMTNYATRKLEIPAGAALEIRKEKVKSIRHATESSTADLVIERGTETN
jgi:hypothetical protein